MEWLYLLLILGQIFVQRGVSVPVKTIYSPDGDLIDCINRTDQPAFDHPLLKNHIIQEFPTGMPRTEMNVKKMWQVWHETGEECPPETIPVRRESGDQGIAYKKRRPIPNEVDVAKKATAGHKYAIAYLINRQEIYGTRATLNVWQPMVEGSGDFSLAQIWLASGSYKNADLNTIEAGWQVYPRRYLDNQPRLFTYWTIDAYNSTGGYGIDRPGFVQTSSTVAIGAAISRSSTYGSTQLDITIQIWKDPFTGNWWLALGHNIVPVGYWPAAIFPLLSDHATTVEWGGEVLYRNLPGMNTKAQMGSGEYADKGYKKAAYICNIRVAENNRSLLPIQDFGVQADNPKYYTVKKVHNSDCGNHFYYGGPGPQRSKAVRGTLASAFRVVYFGVICLVFVF